MQAGQNHEIPSALIFYYLSCMIIEVTVSRLHLRSSSFHSFKTSVAASMLGNLLNLDNKRIKFPTVIGDLHTVPGAGRGIRTEELIGHLSGIPGHGHQCT